MSSWPNRKIIHVDLDCFYAAVEEKYNPSLKGKPVGIGGPPDSRSVLCTANYAARKFGVKAALPSSQAVRLCPDLILIPPDFVKYKAESLKVRKILDEFTDQIEPLSLDEAYLDVSKVKIYNSDPVLMAEAIQYRVAKEVGLDISVGVSENKLLAKIASDWNKPKGIFSIHQSEAEKLLAPMPLRILWGIGKVTSQQLNQRGLERVSDLQKMQLPELAQYFSNRAELYYKMVRGVDDRPVVSFEERKSLSVEETFEQDFERPEDLRAPLKALVQELNMRLKGSSELKVKNLFVKLKTFDFKQSTCEERFVGGKITEENFLRLMSEAFFRLQNPIRLLGIGVRFDVKEASSDSAKDQLTFLSVSDDQ